MLNRPGRARTVRPVDLQQDLHVQRELLLCVFLASVAASLMFENHVMRLWGVR
jgi:hypothetical protein